MVEKQLASVQVVTALGKVWHPEHFVCTQCETELGSRNFFEKDGRPYCENDYFTLFSPHCAHCNKPILNVRVVAPARRQPLGTNFSRLLGYSGTSRAVVTFKSPSLCFSENGHGSG